MQTKTRTETRSPKQDWLQKLKQLVEQIALRDSLLADLCPMRQAPDDERKLTLHRVAEINQSVSTTVTEAMALEGGGKDFGVCRLVKAPDPTTATAMMLLVAARLDPNASRMLRRVEDLVGMISARDPVEAVRARALFRADSAIAQYVALGSGVVLDDRSVVLKEGAFNVALGLGPDVTEYECAHETRSGRWR